MKIRRVDDGWQLRGKERCTMSRYSLAALPATYMVMRCKQTYLHEVSIASASP